MGQSTANSQVPIRFTSPGLLRQILKFNPLVNSSLVEEIQSDNPEMKIIAALAEKDALDESLTIAYLSSHLNIDALDLSDIKKYSNEQAKNFALLLPEKFSLEHRCVPIGLSSNNILVALTDPLDLDTVEALKALIHKPVRVCIAAEREILAILQLHHSGSTDAVIQAAARASSVQDISFITEKQEVLVLGKEELETKPVVTLVNTILTDSIASNVSDIHFEPSPAGLEVKVRIDGVLSTRHEVPKEIQAHVTSRIKLLAQMDITERRRPQDGRLSVRLANDSSVDMRISCVPTPSGEKIVIRILGGDKASEDLDNLGIEATLKESLERILQSTDGIVLVTGPTGSGKTTTLYSCLYKVMGSSRHVVTVEDPIELRIPGITQIQVQKNLNVTFASGLRSILRQDPDVILVGEIRDLETAETALHAAQTGHLVLSTLHTIDAPSAITRLKDMGVEPFLIGSSVRAIVAQRLLRRVCQSCARQLTEEEIANLDLDPADHETLRTGVGCHDCRNTGFSGRIGIYSMLAVDSEVKAAIVDDRSEAEIAALGSACGFESLYDVAMRLAIQGTTCPKEIVRVLGNSDTSTSTTLKAVSDSTVSERPSIPSEIDFYVEPVDATVVTHAKNGLDNLSEPLVPTTQSRPTKVEDSLLSMAESLEDVDNRKRVLLIDNDAKIRAVVAAALREQEYEVFESATGEEALTIVDSLGPTIIICDVVFPTMDGTMLISSLREKSSANNTPIMVLTGEQSEELEIDLIEQGVSDYVLKTSSLKVILSRIKRLT